MDMAQPQSRGGLLTVDDAVGCLVRDTRYDIGGYNISHDTIVLFVVDTNAEQDEIPKTMFGRNVMIVKSL